MQHSDYMLSARWVCVAHDYQKSSLPLMNNKEQKEKKIIKSHLEFSSLFISLNH